jgi:hypothetical protein
MMATPTKIPEVEPTSTRTSPPTVVLPDSAVIRTIPPERTPPAPATSTRRLWAALIGLGVLVLVAIGVIVWQQSRVDDAEAELRAADTERGVATIQAQQLQTNLALAEAELAQARTEVRGLERRVERLEAALAGTTQENEQMTSELDSTDADLRRTENQLARAQTREAEAKADAQQARSELKAIAGTPLADGEWTGRMFMFGGTQVPPMLAFDERKLFRGQDAIDAMIADGVPRATAQACGSDCVYWRNPSNGWRIMEISPYANVTLHGFGPDTTMNLAEFTRAFNGDGTRNAKISAAPYRLTMAGGQVTRIEEVRVGW